MKQTLGVQLYTLRERLKTEEEYILGMKKLKDMGIKYVQYSGVTAPISPERVREIMDDIDMKICCSHMPLDRLLNEPEKIAEENIAMGCPIVGLSIYNKEITNKEDLTKYLDEMQKIGSVMKSYGLTFGIHNHDYEFNIVDGKTVLQHTKENTDPDAVNFILCPFWVQTAGFDPIECLYDFKGRVKVCHYKDMNTNKGRTDRFTIVGQGIMDYPSIYKVCEEIGVEYALVEQDICQGDEYECVKTSLDYIGKLGNEYDKGNK